jgi:putative molybdopterin biosynthesis protein
MNPVIQKLSAYERIKLLADPRRMEVLRRLMAAPATLSQLGEALGQHPAWVRHHLKKLEDAGLVHLAEIRVTQSVTEKYYQAEASAFLIQELLLPGSSVPQVVFSGSHDLAMEELARQLHPDIHIFSLPIGSLDGLISLRQGLCHLAGSHLRDENGEYNSPTLRHLFPEQNVRVITLAHRTQGLMLVSGNPQQIRRLEDLARPDVIFINRNPGSGTRVWLEQELKRLGIPASQVNGFGNAVKTHRESALQIQQGQAQAAIGIQAAAEQAGLDFIPLFEERYDLVFPHDQHEQLTPIFETLQSAAFRRRIGGLAGYATAHSGETISF